MIIRQQRADASRIDPRASRNAQQTEQPRVRRECRPLHIHITIENGLDVPVYLARPLFTAPVGKNHATTRRSKGKSDHPANDVPNRRKSESEPPGTPPLQPQYNEGGVRVLACTPTMEIGSGSPIFLPDLSSRHRTTTNTRQTRTSRWTLREYHHDDDQQHRPYTSIRPITADAANASKPTSGPHETPNITAPVRQRELRPFPVRPRWKTDLRNLLPARPQFTAPEDGDDT
jgi:hypothetical protein